MDIQQLQERYEISRAALFRRIKAADIIPSKDNRKSVFSEAQVAVLDDLHGHLKYGGTLDNYVPVTNTKMVNETRDETRDETVYSKQNSKLYGGASTIVIHDETILDDPRDSSLLPSVDTKSEELLFKLLDEMTQTNQIKQIKDKLELLEYVIDNKLELSTSEIHKAIGIKPKTDNYQYGQYLFSKSGKMGRQRAWKVIKI